ncbi:MAG: DUF4386 domain-containing protein [Anaerolineae bacterium]|nr:DUF4386 domain-containing protein [Anaerolineae bacterium]
MSKDRRASIIVGVLYIMGTVFGVLSVVFIGTTFAEPVDLAIVQANAFRVTISALCVLAMGLSLSMVPVVAYPVLKKHNETLATGYVVFRGALETFTYMAMVTGWLVLLILGREYVQAGAAEGSTYQALGTAVLGANASVNHILKIVFPLGAAMFYIVLYQSKLIPRWITIWGLIGVALHFTEGLLSLYGVFPDPELAETIMALPIGLQEMVMAVWFIVKGFNPSAVVSD